MTRLKKDQIGIKRLSSVTDNYERPVCKKIRLNFNETISSPLAPRCRHRSALRHVLVKRSSCDCFLHHDFDSESSLQRNVTSSVGRRSESKERRTEALVPADRISNAPETRRRPIGSLPLFLSRDEPGNLAS